MRNTLDKIIDLLRKKADLHMGVAPSMFNCSLGQ